MDKQVLPLHRIDIIRAAIRIGFHEGLRDIERTAQHGIGLGTRQYAHNLADQFLRQRFDRHGRWICLVQQAGQTGTQCGRMGGQGALDPPGVMGPHR